LFVARLVEKSGKRLAKIFKAIPEARNWPEDTRQADKHGILPLVSEITVDQNP